MRSAITVSLVPEARQGPFVFHAGLEDACHRAAVLGFDAIEIFPPGASALDPVQIRSLLAAHDLKLAAVGTGAGWLCHQLSLTADQPEVRARAEEFIRGIIDVAGALGAPAIIGSMQGRATTAAGRPAALVWLGEAVSRLAEHAWQHHGQTLLIEPLNRYETNLLNTLAETSQWLTSLPTGHARILADLFHMNIEEADMAAALRHAGSLVGHVHFADSNRNAVGLGHSQLAPAVEVLRELNYEGYLSAEIFPRPDADSAARQTIASFHQLVGGS